MLRICLTFNIVVICTVTTYATETDTWQLGWFPNKPGETDINPIVNLAKQQQQQQLQPHVPDAQIHLTEEAKSSVNDTWKGNWFPKSPGQSDTNPLVTMNSPEKDETMPETDKTKSEHAEIKTTVNDTWTGNWFPIKPGQTDDNNRVELNGSTGKTHLPQEPSETKDDCDNGIDGIEIDFNPRNLTQAGFYVCQEDRHDYSANYSINPLLFVQTMPKQYVGAEVCLDTVIDDYNGIPMYGDYRPVGPQYGEYTFVPPQRWLNSLAAGAIVMLYHPCAEETQVELLKSVIQRCLRRHIISASELPSAERPLVLITWGSRLEMSAISPSVVIPYIRKYALHGVPKIHRQRPKKAYHYYDHMLLKPADVVSNESDAELCPNLM